MSAALEAVSQKTWFLIFMDNCNNQSQVKGMILENVTKLVPRLFPFPT